MIPLATLLCNYGRGFCLIDIGTDLRYANARDVIELVPAIEEYVDHHNRRPQTLHLDRLCLRHPRKSEAGPKGSS